MGPRLFAVALRGDGDTRVGPVRAGRLLGAVTADSPASAVARFRQFRSVPELPRGVRLHAIRVLELPARDWDERYKGTWLYRRDTTAFLVATYECGTSSEAHVEQLRRARKRCFTAQS